MTTRMSSLLRLLPLLLLACSSERLTQPLHPVFSFSGPGVNGRIAYTSDWAQQNRFRLFTQNIDGTDVHQLVDAGAPGQPLSQTGSPAWSPDGSKIAFTGFEPGADCSGVPCDTEIYVMADVEGGAVTRLTVSAGNDRWPEWSPDGQKIAFLTNRGADGYSHLWVMNADGTNQVQLMPDVVEDRVSWSPDGTKIAYTTTTGGGEVSVMNADGSNKINITNSPGSADNSPAWSADGTKIAFVSSRTGSGLIWIMGADGSNPYPLPNTTSGTRPAWSPDGTKIIYDVSVSYLLMVNADGSSSGPTNVPIPGNGAYKEASWQWTPVAPPPPPPLVGLFANIPRTIRQNAYPWGATIYPRLYAAASGSCYRIRWFAPGSAVPSQSDTFGPGSTSYDPPSFAVPAIGPSGTWSVIVDQNTAGSCVASFSDPTVPILFDVARAVVLGAGTNGIDNPGGDVCVAQINQPPISCTASGTVMSVRSQSSDNVRSFLRFDLSAIPATATITDAKLRLTVATSSGLTGLPEARTYNSHRVDPLAAWGEGTFTWATQPATTGSPVTATIGPTGTPGQAGGDPQTWVKWTVTADVQGFVSNASTNKGWRISDATENNGSPTLVRFFTTEATNSCGVLGCNTYMPVLLIDYVTVLPDNTSITTVIHDGDPGTDVAAAGVTSVPLGTTVHDKATVSNTGGGTGNGTPQGNVAFTFWTDASCGNDGGTSSSAGASVSVNGSGVAHPSTSKGPLGAGSYSFKAAFTSGDPAKWNNSIGGCEPLTIEKAQPTLTTAVHAGADHSTDVQGGYVYQGTNVHDSSELSDLVSGFIPGGTVTYYFYKNSGCSGTPFATSSAMNLVAGVPPESGAFPSGQPLGPGVYGYKASYSGDPNYEDDTSDCEPFTIVPKSVVTSNALCTFDRGSQTGRQFKAIYTPEGQGLSTSKLNATNLGQFFYNVFYIGNGPTTVTITIPAGFVTQGATPVQVYDAVTPVPNGETCYTPGSQIASSQEQVTGASGGTITVNLPALSGGFAYIAVHLGHYWKGVAVGCSKQVVGPLNNAVCSNVTINDLSNYIFGTSGGVTDNQTIQNLNDFKKDPGIGGLVLKAGSGDPVASAQVEVYNGSTKKLASLTTDEDGWYMWEYKYTGKAATFVVKLPAYGLSQTVALKANGYLVVNFTVP